MNSHDTELKPLDLNDIDDAPVLAVCTPEQAAAAAYYRSPEGKAARAAEDAKAQAEWDACGDL